MPSISAWTRIFIACFSVFGSLWLPVAAQTPDQTLAFANQLAAAQNYPDAISAYRRALFFDEGEQERFISHRLADCYLQTGHTDKAVFYYDIAYALTPKSNDSLRHELIFNKTAALILAGDYAFAQLELLNLPQTISDNSSRKRTFYSAVIAFQREEFDLAQEYFISLVGTDSPESELVEKLFRKNHRLKRFKPLKVQIMSLLVPGLGQAWCGDWKNGVNSFFLTSGFAVLFVSTAMNLALLDAVLSVLPWYQRYYIGGVTRSRHIALDKIQDERSEIYKQLLGLVAGAKGSFE